MIRHSFQPRDRIFVKGYGFLSFAKGYGFSSFARNNCKNVDKNISKN